MGDYLPTFFEGASVPVTVGSGGITGGTLITTTGVAAGDASAIVAGVAGFDALQAAVVTVFREGIHRGVASGSIANGDPLCAAGSNKIRKWVAGTDAVASLIARAWSAASDGETVTYALFGV